MRSFYFVALFFAIFGYSFDSPAAISVTIVDAPEKTLVYAPVRIIGVIENIGNFTEAVSLSDAWDIEIGQANEYLPLTNDHHFDVGEHFVSILNPEEKYYISKYIGEFGIGPEFTGQGVYEVRIVLSGTGQCIPLHLSKPYDLERDLSAPGDRVIYKCWRGKVYSQPVKIAIESPASKEDLEVLEFVRSGEALKLGSTPGDWSQPHPTAVNFAHSYRFLREKYPSSYYTFVAGLYAAAGSGNAHLLLKQILELQPQHPLRQYALVQLAIEEIDRNLPLEKGIESDWPLPMKQFIEQHSDEVARSKRERQ